MLYFETTINSTYILNLLENKKIYEYSYFLYLIEIFDNFMESDSYQDFVETIYKKVFTIFLEKIL